MAWLLWCDTKRPRGVRDATPVSSTITTSPHQRCGGLVKNELYLTAHADALGVPIHLPREDEARRVAAPQAGGREAAMAISARRARRDV